MKGQVKFSMQHSQREEKDVGRIRIEYLWNRGNGPTTVSTLEPKHGRYLKGDFYLQKAKRKYLFLKKYEIHKNVSFTNVR